MTSHAPARDSILLESGTNEVEFIEFFLGSVSYGINVSKVQRVLALSSATVNAVAQAPESVVGLIHILGKPVMLLDLKSALALPRDPQPPDPARQLVLVTTFNKQTTAFVIDGISKIHRTSWERFEPLADCVSGSANGGYSTGTVTLEDRIIVILDLERLMLSRFPTSSSKQLDVLKLAAKEGREAVSIVYAEDSKMVRALTERILASAGYSNVVSFDNGADALRHLQALSEEAAAHGSHLRDEVDLVLTDIEMPKMDGLTLCRHVKSGLGGGEPPKVVIYSSLINREMAAKCASVGADAQLAKPEIETIVELVDELCL